MAFSHRQIVGFCVTCFRLHMDGSVINSFTCVLTLLVSVCLDPRDPGLSLSAGRRVMAEPDYLEGDCDELIKPKKLINPVKNSRNHQDLHRELLMNQKRSADRDTSTILSVSL